MKDWISVKDKLPTLCEEVIVYFSSGRVTVSEMFYSGNFSLEGLYGVVTHWQPLPEPPVEGYNKKQTEDR